MRKSVPGGFDDVGNENSSFTARMVPRILGVFSIQICMSSDGYDGYDGL